MKLIVGLGNPGDRYDQTRHNAGFWFVDDIARAYGGLFRSESRFFGEACRVVIDGRDVWLLKPSTFMNRSGTAVSTLARFYNCLLYTSPSPRDRQKSRMPSSA